MSVEVITYSEIDRLFFEYIRRAVVVSGKIPDTVLYATPALYEAAKTTLRNTLSATKDYLIEVFGVGGYDARDEKTFAKIVIDRCDETVGTIGGFPSASFTTVSGTSASQIFSKNYFPDNSNDIEYEIRTICPNNKYDRITAGIIKQALHGRRFLKTVGADGNYTTKNVMVSFLGSARIGDINFFERVYKFIVEDVFIEDEVVIDSSIPVLTTLQYFVYSQTDNAFLMSNINGQYDRRYYDPTKYQTD